MPLVFVHGVATRQTPTYKTEVEQRNALFRRLVVGEGDPVWNPDWGSDGVHFRKGGWVPRKGATETWAGGAGVPAQSPSAAAVLAMSDLQGAVDLALGSLLAERVRAGEALTDADLGAFDAAVAYLESGGDPAAFNPSATDQQFAETLVNEISAESSSGRVPVAMGTSQLVKQIGQALRRATDPLRNAGSDAVLKLIREPLSRQVALFLGDVFVYLRWRETDPSRIFGPIVKDLAAASAATESGQRLIVVGHSLGAVILYDLLSDPTAVAEIAAASGKPLQIDVLVTVGAQPGLFADMGLYERPVDAEGRLQKPECVTTWMNVYDFTDVLSFRTEPFFAGVSDFEFDNVSGALEAHTSYFQRPSFYQRLRKRLT